MEHAGEYGGVVKRKISNAGGKSFIKGAILSPEDVKGWPLANRIAMHKSGQIDWFGPPQPAETAARESGAPAPARRTTASAEKKTAPARPRRAAAK